MAQHYQQIGMARHSARLKSKVYNHVWQSFNTESMLAHYKVDRYVFRYQTLMTYCADALIVVIIPS